jgi:hypothetical protein
MTFDRAKTLLTDYLNDIRIKENNRVGRNSELMLAKTMMSNKQNTHALAAPPHSDSFTNYAAVQQPQLMNKPPIRNFIPKCFNCGVSGHLASQCTALWCSNCGKTWVNKNEPGFHHILHCPLRTSLRKRTMPQQGGSYAKKPYPPVGTGVGNKLPIPASITVPSMQPPRFHANLAYEIEQNMLAQEQESFFTSFYQSDPPHDSSDQQSATSTLHDYRDLAQNYAQYHMSSSQQSPVIQQSDTDIPDDQVWNPNLQR